MAASNTSATEWAEYFNANSGMQEEALNSLYDVSREIDIKHGTDVLAIYIHDRYRGHS
jgi:hypothetical protein